MTFWREMEKPLTLPGIGKIRLRLVTTTPPHPPRGQALSVPAGTVRRRESQRLLPCAYGLRDLLTFLSLSPYSTPKVSMARTMAARD